MPHRSMDRSFVNKIPLPHGWINRYLNEFNAPWLDLLRASERCSAYMRTGSCLQSMAAAAGARSRLLKLAAAAAPPGGGSAAMTPCAHRWAVHARWAGWGVGAWRVATSAARQGPLSDMMTRRARSACRGRAGGQAGPEGRHKPVGPRAATRASRTSRRRCRSLRFSCRVASAAAAAAAAWGPRACPGAWPLSGVTRVAGGGAAGFSGGAGGGRRPVPPQGGAGAGTAGGQPATCGGSAAIKRVWGRTSAPGGQPPLAAGAKAPGSCKKGCSAAGSSAAAGPARAARPHGSQAQFGRQQGARGRGRTSKPTTAA